MTLIAVLGFLAFMFCLALTPLVRDYFLRHGLTDKPDAHRKLHRIPVPRSGGISIMLSYFAALGTVYACIPAGAQVYVQHRTLFEAVLPATVLIFLVGVADDLLNLRPRHKLLGQTIAAVLAVSLGARLTLHHGPSWVGFGISVMWLLLCTNAVNLIDGMDGLAAGVALTATVTTLVVGLLSGNAGLAMTTAPLAGALLAFLRYNFTPASVFLGDSGSLTLGFLLGCLGIVWSKPMGGWGMLGPLFTLALPLMDVSLAIGRRFLRRVPIFEGDRGHIHHRVQDLGLSVRGAALLLYACCALLATMALLRSLFKGWSVAALVATFLLLAMLGVRQLRYVEFRAARRSLSYSRFRRSVQEEIHLQEMCNALQQANTPDECWQVVRRTCDSLDIPTVQLKIFGKTFVQFKHAIHTGRECTMHVPLDDESWLVLTGPVNIMPRAIAATMQSLEPAIRRQLLLMHERALVETPVETEHLLPRAA